MRILLCMPRHDNKVYFEAAASFFRSVRADSPLQVEGMSPGMSILTSCFNAGWVHAINLYEAGQLDGFAMLHADVAAGPGWIDVLHRELESSGADVISAVIPIKDNRGLTSTALDDTGDPWRVRRLTMREVVQLPATFTDEDVGGPLLLNTGCWLARLGPWCKEVLFSNIDCLREENGRYVARVISEDWGFSRQLRERGVKLAATRVLEIKHLGEIHWGNQRAWGWDTDEANGVHPEAVEARRRRAESGSMPTVNELTLASAGA